MSDTLLIRTLIDSPHLAAHMKSVTIEEGPSIRFGTRRKSNLSILQHQYQDKMRSLITLYISAVGAEEFRGSLYHEDDLTVSEVAEVWIKRLRTHDYFEYVLSFLLILVPNLEELHIDLCKFSPGPDGLGLSLCILSLASRLQRMPLQSQNAAICFRKLKVLSLRKEQYVGDHLDFEIPLDTIAQILSMPSLRSFSAVKISVNNGCGSFPHDSAIENLSLFECYFLPHLLEHIMVKLTSLRSITVQLVDEFDSEESGTGTWPKFIESLAHLHGSLEHLSLRDPSTAYRRTHQLLPRLENFRKLRFLEIEADFLEDRVTLADRSASSLPKDRDVEIYNFTTLPTSLEELVIGDSVLSTIDHLQHNVGNLAFLPALKIITLDFQYNMRVSDSKAALELSRRYKEHGVKLAIKFCEERQGERPDNRHSWYYYTWTVCAADSRLESEEITCVRDIF